MGVRRIVDAAVSGLAVGFVLGHAFSTSDVFGAVSLFLIGVVAGALIRNVRRLNFVVVRLGDHVVYLPGRAYLDFMRRLIRGARKRVYVAMFAATLSPSPRALIDAVAESRAREKLVVLETGDSAPLSDNERVVEYLRARGVKAVLAPGGNTQHLKLVVVDDWVVIGSHNWTERALTQNDEVSVAIRSKRLAERAARDVKRVARGEKLAGN